MSAVPSDQPEITKDGFVELFDLQVRGQAAAAFLKARIEPPAEHWSALRGERAFTMRDLGEIAALTGTDPQLLIKGRS